MQAIKTVVASVVVLTLAWLGACSSGGGVSSTGGLGSGGGLSSSSSSSSSAAGGGTASSSSAASTGGGVDAGPDAADTGTFSRVTISGYQVIVEARSPDGTLAPGAPWDLKGIAWSPTGAGEPFDGAGTSYANHAAQDLPLMKAAHIDTVRTYGAFEDSAQGLAVLDQLHQQGMMVAMTVFAAYDDTTYGAAVTAFKDHPAVLLWIVGNEWNYNKLYSGHTYDECAQRVSDVATAIKALDPNHPVAVGFGELPTAAQLAQVPEADLWALNLYPNLSFSDRFTKWKALTGKPFFVSEYGSDAFDNKTSMEDQASQALALSKLTTEIRQNLSAQDPSKVAVGGCPYEWNDEWWKSGDPSTHDDAGFANQGVYPDGFANEEWWGIVTAQRVPRAAYTTLQQLYQ